MLEVAVTVQAWPRNHQKYAPHRRRLSGGGDFHSRDLYRLGAGNSLHRHPRHRFLSALPAWQMEADADYRGGTHYSGTARQRAAIKRWFICICLNPLVA